MEEEFELIFGNLEETIYMFNRKRYYSINKLSAMTGESLLCSYRHIVFGFIDTKSDVNLVYASKSTITYLFFFFFFF